MASTSLTIRIEAQDIASRTLGQVSGGLSGLAKAAVSPLGALGSLANSIGGIGLAAAGLSSIGSTISSVFEGAKESEENVAQLNQVLKSTHGAAGMSAQAVEDLSTALMNQTKFDDDTV